MSLKLAGVAVFAGIALMPFIAHDKPAEQAGWLGGDEQIYVVESATGDKCQLLTVQDSTSGDRQVSPQEGCAAIDPRLDEVRLWHDRKDGTVELDDSQGRALIALGQRGGSVYQNLNPANLILTITPKS